MKRLVCILLLVLWIGPVYAEDGEGHPLTVDDIFPSDRVLDVQITVDPGDWDTVRFQERGFLDALHESRQYGPVDHPYTYVAAHVTIDGVEFPQVGIRKKGFIGSQNSTRPSLKIKLNHVDKTGQINGLTNLTFNNNQQDVSLISQFMGYRLFNAAGSPAPRCAYAKLTVNGQNLGIYAHVERIHRPFLKWGFGNDDGVLYEGTVVDFYPDWAGSFEKKVGQDKAGRQKIQQLIDVLDNPDENIETVIGQLVDLDSFYTFWAMEGLAGFWDGYSGNANNFFIYLNPETDKFHFIPWGADSLFEKFSPIRDDTEDPVSVKIQGLVTRRLYQSESGRQRYEQALRKILERHWNEPTLLAETERIEALLKPYLTVSGVSQTEQLSDQSPASINTKKVVEDDESGENKTKDVDGGKGAFITDWSLLGPFYTRERHDLDQDFLLEYGGETNISPDDQQKFRNSKNRALKWRPISVKSDIVDLRKQIGSLEDVTAYAFCQIESAVEEYVELGLGSDDSVKVWINSAMVHQSEEPRGVVIDQDRFITKLNPGSNNCLIKVSQGMGGWGFVIRPVDRFPLSEGVMLSGQLILEGQKEEKFPPIRLQAVMDSDGNLFKRDLGVLSNGERYQRAIRTTRGTELKWQQAVTRGVILAEHNMTLATDPEKVVHLTVDTDSPLAVKILNLGASQSAHKFIQALEERRKFIRQRQREIMAEIADGMPQWQPKIGIGTGPWALKSVFGTPIPLPLGPWKNWEVHPELAEVTNFTRLMFKGSIVVLVVISLCCFQLFGRRYSIHWYLQVLKKYAVFGGRARRNEFWMFKVLNTLIFIIFPIYPSDVQS